MTPNSVRSSLKGFHGDQGQDSLASKLSMELSAAKEYLQSGQMSESSIRAAASSQLASQLRVRGGVDERELEVKMARDWAGWEVLQEEQQARRAAEAEASKQRDNKEKAQEAIVVMKELLNDLQGSNMELEEEISRLQERDRRRRETPPLALTHQHPS